MLDAGATYRRECQKIPDSLVDQSRSITDYSIILFFTVFLLLMVWSAKLQEKRDINLCNVKEHRTPKKAKTPRSTKKARKKSTASPSTVASIDGTYYSTKYELRPRSAAGRVFSS